MNRDSDLHQLSLHFHTPAVYFSEDIVQLHHVWMGEENSSQMYARATAVETFRCLRSSQRVFLSLSFCHSYCVKQESSHQTPSNEVLLHFLKWTNSQATPPHSSVPMTLEYVRFSWKGRYIRAQIQGCGMTPCHRTLPHIWAWQHQQDLCESISRFAHWFKSTAIWQIE